MQDLGSPSTSVAVSTVFSRLSRRRHIDLQRCSGCLCRG
jgi:hypothetical protein